MRERPITFGSTATLLGIVTTPAEPRVDLPGVLLLNAGLLHRVGPNRLNVELARSLADRGFTSLRFDMAGIGDSELATGSVLDIERSRQDVVEAMDGLAASDGLERFVLIGLCTGAYNAFRAALVDERVIGAVLIDGYSYPTLRSRVRHYGRRVWQLRRWGNFLARRFARAGELGTDSDLVVFENEEVSRGRFEAELTALVGRDVRLFMVYTEMGPLAYNYERQLADAFPAIDMTNVEIVYYTSTDHTFTLPGNRARFINDVGAWLHRQFVESGTGVRS